MKNIKSILSFSLMIILITGLSGCKKEYKTTTKINEDGTCDRIIVARTDSSNLERSLFNFPSDKSWKVQHRVLENDTQKVYLAEKHFDDINQINDEFKNDDKFKIDIIFEKKFRWFYTYFNYAETYKSFNPFNRIPIESYLSKEDYDKYTSGDTTKYLKEKIDSFLVENIYEEFYTQLKNEINTINDPALTMESLEIKKKELRDSLITGSGETKAVLKTFINIFKSKRTETLERSVEKIMNKIESGFDYIGRGDGEYVNEVIIPGLILSTNADAIESNKVTWKFNEKRFCFSDFTMTVESRVINLWAIYVTIGIVLVIALLLIVSWYKRKN